MRSRARAGPALGAILVGGVPLSPKQAAGTAARSLGVAHVPGDRQRVGLVTAFPAYENMVLGLHREPRWRAGPFLDRAAMRRHAARAMAGYDVRPPDRLLEAARFSGGNQQKIVLAREIAERPRLLLVGQPT